MWVKEQPNGKYRYREHYKCPVTNKWKKVSVTLSSNSKQAERKARTLLQEKITERLNAVNPNNLTFEDVARQYFETKYRTVKINSYNSYIMLYNVFIKYLGDNVLIHKLDAKLLNKIFSAITLEYSFRYSQMVFFIVKQILEHAKMSDYISDIAFLKLVKLKRPPQTMEQLEKENTKFLNKEELSEVLTKIKAIHYEVGLACEFLALSGLRIGELLALEYKNYNPINSTIDVTGTLTKSFNKTTPKNAYSYRTININTRGKEIIDYFVSLHDKIKPTTFIFNKINYNNVYLSLRKVDYKIPITPHMFRHTHISLLTELNLPLKTIMKRVGHNNPKTTLSIYTHVTSQMENDLQKKLENMEF